MLTLYLLNIICSTLEGEGKIAIFEEKIKQSDTSVTEKN